MTVDLGKKTGAISLDKGQRVTIEKTPSITATVSWESGTDYDVYAVILLKDGTQKVCSTFGSKEQPVPTPVVGGIRHNGDVTRSAGPGRKDESLTIVLDKDIDQIAVAAYSAQSNGAGSFRQYKVSMSVDNGAGTVVTVPASEASKDPHIYTCVPAIIHNTEDGAVIERVELYSRPGSEHRPEFEVAKTSGGLFKKKTIAGTPTLVMDAGSVNVYK